MTDARITATAFSVQAAKPSQKYGVLAALPLNLTLSEVYLRVALAGIPQGATITSATLRMYQGVAASGTHTLTLYRVTGDWTSSMVWANRATATATGAVGPVSKTNPARGDVWDFNVTSFVQAFVSGTQPNLGFKVAKNQTPQIVLYGTEASGGNPVLLVSYTLAPSTPSNLHPAAGAVSIARPTVSFDGDDDMISLQVQIDPSSNAVSPAFDSGEVAATAGLLDLTQSTPGGTYAGLSNGATTTWRARQKNSQGWSAWSTWATFSRSSKPTLTITSPSTGAITDGTPPVQWSVSGGTQKSWQVRLRNAAGAVLADSGKQIGTATSWTPTKGYTVNGQTGYIEVLIWDTVDREATTGDPVYTYQSLAVTLTMSGAVTPVSSLAVSQSDKSPVVTITGTRSTIPDFVQVYVNGAKVATYTGAAVFSGTNMSIPDVSAPMNIPATYRVAAVVNGVVASGGNTVNYTPRCIGIWLIDELDHTAKVPIWTDQKQDQSQAEVAIVHTPITEGSDEGEVVRRVLKRFAPIGAIAGTLLDVVGSDVVQAEAWLRSWKNNDAGYLYRLVLGNMNRTVIIGDLEFEETPLTGTERVLDVSFNWWSKSA